MAPVNETAVGTVRQRTRHPRRAVRNPSTLQKLRRWCPCAHEEGFFGRLSEIPMVGDSLTYIDERYHKFANKHPYLGIFIAAMLASIIRVGTIFFMLSKLVISFDYLNTLACKGLDKVELEFPDLLEPTDEVKHDFWIYLMKKISGVTDNYDLPTTIKAAIRRRIRDTLDNISKWIHSTFIVRGIIYITKEILDGIEYIIDHLLPPKANEKSEHSRSDISVWNKAKFIYLKARVRIIILAHTIQAKEQAEEKKIAHEIHEQWDKLDIQKLELVVKHWLENAYKVLHDEPPHEFLYHKSIRLVKLFFIGLVLSFLGALSNSCNYLKEKAPDAWTNFKHFICSIFAPLNNIVIKLTIDILKCIQRLILEIIKFAPKQMLHLLNLIYKYVQTVVNDLIEEENKIRFSSTPKGHAATCRRGSSPNLKLILDEDPLTQTTKPKEESFFEHLFGNISINNRTREDLNESSALSPAKKSSSWRLWQKTT